MQNELTQMIGLKRAEGYILMYRSRTTRFSVAGFVGEFGPWRSIPKASAINKETGEPVLEECDES